MPQSSRGDGALVGCRKCHAPPFHSQVSPLMERSSTPPNSTAAPRAVSKASAAFERGGGSAACHWTRSHSKVSPRATLWNPPNMTVRAREKSYVSVARDRAGNASAVAGAGTCDQVAPSQLHSVLLTLSEDSSRVRCAARSYVIGAPRPAGGCVGVLIAIHVKPSNSHVREASFGSGPPYITARLRSRSY